MHHAWMEARVILKYEFSRDDDFGWLEMEIRTPNFSGVAGYWVQWQDVEEWIPTLLPYPMATPSAFDWGYCESDGSYHSVIALKVVRANATGDLEVVAMHCDHIDRRNCCGAVFRTTYSELETFAIALKAVMNRAGEEAVLIGCTHG